MFIMQGILLSRHPSAKMIEKGLEQLSFWGRKCMEKMGKSD